MDGFDELSSAGWVQFNQQLRQVRFSTVEIIRNFVTETDSATPIIISGRGSYFDNESECLNAFGIAHRNCTFLTLNEFNEKQIKAYLAKFNYAGVVPDWMPLRPLLLGYLLVRQFLTPNFSSSGNLPGKGWDMMLKQICQREASTHTNVDPNLILGILEWLGTLVRAKGAITSPLSSAELTEAFKGVVGIDPDKAAETLLMRLPGLSPGIGLSQGQRAFIDEDVANAAAGGSVANFIRNPFHLANPYLLSVVESLSDVGVQVCEARLEDENVPEAQLGVAEEKAIDLGNKDHPSHTLACDIFRIASDLGFKIGDESKYSIIREVLVESLDLSSIEVDYSNVVFKNCIFRNIYLSPIIKFDRFLPHFDDCEVEYIDGRIALSDLPKDKFQHLKCNQFGGAFSTNAGVLATGLSEHTKVLLISLRKLFIQKGAGRKKSAFYRGLPDHNITSVTNVLNLLRKHNFAYPTHRGQEEEIWSPNRKMGARVNAILQAPANSNDPIIEELRSW